MQPAGIEPSTYALRVVTDFAVGLFQLGLIVALLLVLVRSRMAAWLLRWLLRLLGRHRPKCGSPESETAIGERPYPSLREPDRRSVAVGC